MVVLCMEPRTYGKSGAAGGTAYSSWQCKSKTRKEFSGSFYVRKAVTNETEAHTKILFGKTEFHTKILLQFVRRLVYKVQLLLTTRNSHQASQQVTN